MAKADPKNTKPRPKSKPGPDARIIAAAVKYAQSIAAIAAGFCVDPDGNFRFAAPERSPLKRDATTALAFLGTHKATTLEGLCAKARVVPAIVNDDTGWFENGGAAFISAFAKDVADFTEPLIVAGWKKSAPEKAVQP